MSNGFFPASKERYSEATALGRALANLGAGDNHLGQQKDQYRAFLAHQFQEPLRESPINGLPDPNLRLRSGDSLPIILMAGVSSSAWIHSDWERTDISDKLQYIEGAIDRSLEMLTWADDWDEAGSPGYAQETWDRAVSFIRNTAARLLQRTGIRVVEPAVLPGPGGSIDIRWRYRDRELLVNIPVGATESATFHGDDHKNIIEGSLDTDEGQDWLLIWLMG